MSCWEVTLAEPLTTGPARRWSGFADPEPGIEKSSSPVVKSPLRRVGRRAPSSPRMVSVADASSVSSR